MDESTTRKLSDLLNGIDTEKEMEEFMELPKVTDAFQSFPDYFRSLASVQAMENSDLIRESGLERSSY